MLSFKQYLKEREEWHSAIHYKGKIHHLNWDDAHVDILDHVIKKYKIKDAHQDREAGKMDFGYYNIKSKEFKRSF